MKTCVATYSLSRLERSGEMKLVDMVDWVADQGVKGLEINGLERFADAADRSRMARALVQRMAKRGVTPTSYTFGANLLLLDCAALAAEVERVKGQVDMAAKLGCTRVRHDVARGFPEGYRGPKTWDSALKVIAPACREVAEYASSYGIVTSMENHGYFAQASERVLKLVKAVNHPNFGITIDIGNFLCVDEEPVPAVRRLAKYASHVHVKDFHRKTRRDDPGQGFFPTAGKNFLRGAIVGHGDVDVRACLGLIRKAGYDGWYSLEFEGMEDPRLGVKVGLDNLKRYLEALK
jgi:sugar phosphate isomerase/epimerase